MEHALTFARHLARLVWLLLNDASAFDAQLATLRSLVHVSADGTVTLRTRDWRLVVDDQPLPEHFTGTQDLTTQLIGHSIVELTVAERASPVDLLVLARIVASEPVPGDAGCSVEARLRAMDVRSVYVKVEEPRGPAHTPVIANSWLAAGGSDVVTDGAPTFLSPAAQPETAAAEAAPGDEDAEEIVREQDPEQMYLAFSAAATPKGSMMKLFEQLDAAILSTTAVGQLDALVKLAAESARKQRFDIVADVFYGIVKREAAAEDRTIKRQYAMSVRRLSTPSVLKCVAELLPRRRENYDQYMAIFTRTEEAGVEALVEALISAPSIADRRVYYDALLRMHTGVRTLIHMLGDHRWFVVRNAIELLGEMRVMEADAELTKLLEHRDDRVRTAAASALAKLGATSAAKGVRASLREAPAEVREQTAEAVASHSTGRTADSLIRAFDREADNRLQMAMLAALGQLGTPEAVDKLVEIASSERGILFRKRSTPLRVAAVHALGEVKSASAIASLQSLLRDKNKAVRGAASWVLMGSRRGEE